MPSPSVDQMWQEIRMLKQRVCDLEADLAACRELNTPAPDDVWIDADSTPVADNDNIPVTYQ